MKHYPTSNANNWIWNYVWLNRKKWRLPTSPPDKKNSQNIKKNMELDSFRNSVVRGQTNLKCLIYKNLFQHLLMWQSDLYGIIAYRGVPTFLILDFGSFLTYGRSFTNPCFGRFRMLCLNRSFNHKNKTSIIARRYTTNMYD